MPLHARVGVATGLVVVGELVNVGAARELTALGETPNLAARLQALAEPDTIVIADSTRQLISGSFEYRDLGVATPKGFDEEIRLWQVIGDERVRARLAAVDSRTVTDAAMAPMGRSSFVGREPELAMLRNYWEQACAGQGRVTLLTGDAGIGKSRLVQALVAGIQHVPHLELEFHCSAYYANSPLYPVINLLPGVIGLSREDSDAARLAKLKAFCAGHGVSEAEGLPLLASLLSLPGAQDLAVPPMSPERQKQRTLQTLLGVAMSFAAERPLLVIVEDLQWIDPTTMDLLELLINQVPAARVCALVTARVPFQPRWVPRAHVAVLMLARLTRGETEKMVTGLATSQSIPAETVNEIVARTDGMPLFIEELTKAVLESGAFRTHADEARSTHPRPSPAIPATLQDSLTARLDRLGTGKAVAQLCAALGREFSYPMLRAVSTLDEEALGAQIERLLDAEFLYQRGVPPDSTYIFKHALIQEAAYQSLLRSARRRYHERIAQVIVEQFPSEAQAHPEFVAMHFTESADFEPAILWWQKAGQQAFRRASFAEAINHYAKGLSVLQSSKHSPERDRMELELQVELGYALIPVKGWVAAQSAQAFTRAGELCERIRDAPKQFRALWGLGAFHFVRGDQQRARQVADQGLAVARRAGDIDALIEAWYLSGVVSCARGDFTSGRHDLEECLRLYGVERRDQHHLLYGQDARASALGWLAMVLWALGQADAGLACGQDGLAWARGTAQPFLHARGLAGVGFVRAFRGEPREADGPLREAIAICSEQNFAYFHAVVSAFHGSVMVELGDAAQGIAVMRSSIDGLRTVGSELLLTLIFANLGAAHLAAAQPEQGLVAVAEGLTCVESNDEHWGESELHRIRGELLLAGGNREAEAEACFARSIEVSSRQRAISYRLRGAISLARLWSRRARHFDARNLLSEAIGMWPAGVDTVDLREARRLRQALA
jgi:tetratricopeptide (TPR) repeat protein